MNIIYIYIYIKNLDFKVEGYVLRFVIKSSIVGGIVYYTYKEGLWSKSEETAALYKKLNVKIAPYVKENVPEKITKEVILFDVIIYYSIF